MKTIETDILFIVLHVLTFQPVGSALPGKVLERHVTDSGGCLSEGWVCGRGLGSGFSEI